MIAGTLIFRASHAMNDGSTLSEPVLSHVSCVILSSFSYLFKCDGQTQIWIFSPLG
jgi:hypothetical protein